MSNKWVQGIHMKKGALHKSLGVPQGQNIPQAKIVKATGSSNPKLAARARLALTLRKFHK